jgi:hypothetical protein
LSAGGSIEAQPTSNPAISTIDIRTCTLRSGKSYPAEIAAGALRGVALAPAYLARIRLSAKHNLLSTGDRNVACIAFRAILRLGLHCSLTGSG